MMDLKNLDVFKLLPPSLQEELDYKLFSRLGNKVLCRVIDKIPYVQTCGDVKLLPEVILDNLSWELSVDFYDASLPLETKQGLIENAILFQMMKGTPKALEDMLGVIFDTSEVVEWFDYNGAPGTFKIKTTDYVDSEKYSSIENVINVVKRNSSHLDSFILNRIIDTPLAISSYVHTAKKTTIEATL